MLINEILLQEDNAETRDMMAIAYYVANWFESPEHEAVKGDALTLKQIEREWGQAVPSLKTKTVQWLVYKPIPGESPDPLRFAANNEHLVGDTEFGAYNPPHLHAIGINLNLLAKRGKTSPSTILHEIDHALVDFKSGGRAITAEPYKQPTNKDSYKSYLQHPMEVNARFAQALWNIAVRYDSIEKSNLLPTITHVLAANQITPEIVPDPKQYKKLITRSYKFLDDVGQIIADKPKDKPTLVQRVKGLIKKWTSSNA